MNMVKNGALALGISMAAACSGGPESNNPMTQVEMEQAWLDMSDGVGDRSQAEDSEQLQYINEAILAARDVAIRSGNQRASVVADFMEKNSKPARVTSLGPVTVQSMVKLDADDFYMVALNDEDANLNPISDFYLAQPWNGVYTHQLDTLLMNSEANFKGDWLGILTLHEANHALNRTINGLEKANEEAETRIFQHQLASDLFGEPYDTLLLKTMDDLRADFAQSITQGTAILLPSIDITGITKPDSSEQEKRFANSTVLLDAFFRLMDEQGMNTLAEKQQFYDFLVPQLTTGA